MANSRNIKSRLRRWLLETHEGRRWCVKLSVLQEMRVTRDRLQDFSATLSDMGESSGVAGRLSNLMSQIERLADLQNMAAEAWLLRHPEIKSATITADMINSIVSEAKK